MAVNHLVIRRRNGKLYPARLPSPAEHSRMIALAHQMVCQRQLSYRQAQRALENYAVVRSIGWLSGVIRDFECDKCAEQAKRDIERQDRLDRYGLEPQPRPPAPSQPAAPAAQLVPQRKPARVYEWGGGRRRAGGYLTGQVQRLQQHEPGGW